jgi:hypothetical protein
MKSAIITHTRIYGISLIFALFLFSCSSAKELQQGNQVFNDTIYIDKQQGIVGKYISLSERRI